MYLAEVRGITNSKAAIEDDRLPSSSPEIKRGLSSGDTTEDENQDIRPLESSIASLSPEKRGDSLELEKKDSSSSA